MPLAKEHLVSLQGRDYVLYAGLLSLAHEAGLKAIEVELIQAPTPQNEQVAICRATVILKDGESFSDFGDASPKNTASRVATALIRMASTRAKGRALRDAVNVGSTMLEELSEQEVRQAPPAYQNGKAPPRAPEAGEIACENRRCSRPTSLPDAELSRAAHGAAYCPDCISLLEHTARHKAKMASLPQTGAPRQENGKAKATAAVTAAETQTMADQVTVPDAAPGFEPWYEDGKGKRLQRIAMISACRFDLEAAAQMGLTVEPTEPETLANRDLCEFGRALRVSLKSQKAAREGEPPSP